MISKAHAFILKHFTGLYYKRPKQSTLKDFKGPYEPCSSSEGQGHLSWYQNVQFGHVKYPTNFEKKSVYKHPNISQC